MAYLAEPAVCQPVRTDAGACVRSSRLPYDYDLVSGVTPYTPGNAGQFAHLLNFFQTNDQTGQVGSYFYRLFDLAHVPSRFVDTEQYLNPTMYSGPAIGTEFFHPPFNRVSRYRDPGRVNLNTIFSQNILQGVFAGHAGPTWANFVSSRRGAASPQILGPPNPNVPTYFANPYRPAGSARFVPPTTPAAPQDRLDRFEVESTMLRSGQIGYSTSLTSPFLEKGSMVPYDNTDRNPYFRYQSIQRLGNLVTTRSNVYAVWSTVGYFEVEPSPDNNTPEGLRTHPDGFRLGRELGSDTGNVKRHRGFYIIDRSIPVAFEPGENHNVDRAIRLRRFIE